MLLNMRGGCGKLAVGNTSGKQQKSDKSLLYKQSSGRLSYLPLRGVMPWVVELCRILLCTEYKIPTVGSATDNIGMMLPLDVPQHWDIVAVRSILWQTMIELI